MSQIYKRHLEFMDECRHVFNKEVLRETHINAEGDLIGLRYGADRDCIRMLMLGEEVGFFAQMMKSTNGDQHMKALGDVYDKDMHKLRDEVRLFAEEMEKQLQYNDHKGGWDTCTNEYLAGELKRNLSKTEECISHSEYRRRLANIANISMMLADNDRREEVSRS